MYSLNNFFYPLSTNDYLIDLTSWQELNYKYMSLNVIDFRKNKYKDVLQVTSFDTKRKPNMQI
jgi:acetyl-CoA carboxylase beta subunit